MTVYALAQLTITDAAAYQRYVDEFFDVFSRFDGALLAADNDPEIVEGDWAHEKVVLMSFPDHASFEAWAGSPEYQRISRDRLAGTRSTVLVVRGLA
jgi:uncharacterized protein (DUF1330 family)